MTNDDFYKQKHAAEQVIREMNERSTNKNPETACAPINNQHKKSHHGKTDPPKTEMPFSLNKLLKDGDTALILGLLLILFSENADKRLLFALIYILL